MSKNFNNKQMSVNIGNDMNNSKITNKQNKNMNIDKSDKKHISIQNDYIYTELSKKELKESNKKEKSERFGLATLCGNQCRCIGILINNIIVDKNEVERSTVINLIDLNTGKYLSDHINIEKDSVEHITNKTSSRLVFIEIYGRVYKYDDGYDRYAIDPKKLSNGYVKQLNDKVINPFDVIDYSKLNNISYTEMSYIEDWLQYDLNTNELKHILNYLRMYINRLTSTDLGNDFIYNYIINNYLLNSSQYELYYKELPIKKLNKNHYAELIYLLSNVIIKLSDKNEFSIINALEEISKILLPFMGIIPKLNYKESPLYIQFANNLNVNKSQLLYVTNNIMRNFEIRPFELQYKNDLIKEACHFLKSQIENLNRRIERMRDNEI